jgi:hypothetical protein
LIRALPACTGQLGSETCKGFAARGDRIHFPGSRLLANFRKRREAAQGRALQSLLPIPGADRSLSGGDSDASPINVCQEKQLAEHEKNERAAHRRPKQRQHPMPHLAGHALS